MKWHSSLSRREAEKEAPCPRRWDNVQPPSPLHPLLLNSHTSCRSPENKPIFFFYTPPPPIPSAALRRRLGIISVTSEILSFNSISFPPLEEWSCNQHRFPSHAVMIEIFVVKAPRRCSHLRGFFVLFCFVSGVFFHHGWSDHLKSTPLLPAMSSAVMVSNIHHNWFILSVPFPAGSTLQTWLKMFWGFFSFQCLQRWFQAVIYLNLWTGILIKNVLIDGPITSLSFNCPAVIFEATLFLNTASQPISSNLHKLWKLFLLFYSLIHE